MKDRLNNVKPQMRRVLDLIEQGLSGRLHVADLALCARMSIFHFAREFKRFAGVSPYRYIKNRRIESAKRLLAASDLAVGEISYRVGFSTPSHFSAEFRKGTGANPAEWRRTHQRKVTFPQETDNTAGRSSSNLELTGVEPTASETAASKTK